MKKGRNSVAVCIFIASTILCSVSYGQIRVNWEEFPALVKTITYDVPEGKALLVFEGKEDYQFESDTEPIDQPVKNGLIYKLLVSIDPPSGGINISSPGAEKYPLNYGRSNEESLPALNNKEIRYFKLSIIKQLFCSDQTVELSKTNADIPAEGDDALIILFPNPQTLDLQFDGNITSQKHENDRYRIYMKTGNQKLTVKSKNYFSKTIDLDSLKKEVRFFRVQPPITNDDNITEDPNVKGGNYVIETTPSGAVIQMVGNPPFNERSFKTPYTIEGFKAGSEIITLELERYEPIKDTIVISSSKGKKSKYKLIPKFAFLNCNIEPSIPTSKVLFDGKELIGITQGKDYECPKGTHNIEYSAPHYFPQTKQVSLAAGESIEMNVKLRPKMGSITIESGENANGAEVFINEKSIGKLPIQNYSLQEGDYTISYKKNGLVTEKDSYVLSVNLNENKPVKSPKMIDLRKIKFSTDPQNGATVSIDGIEKGTTPLSLKLPVGTYKVLIKKDNYKDCIETINLFNDQTEFNYTLTPNYNLSLSSKPSGATVRVDGQIMGNTPIDILTTHGTHRIAFAESSSIRRVKHYATDDVPRSKSTVLRKSDFWGVGYVAANEGVEFGGELYLGRGNFVLSGSISKLKPFIEMPTIEGPPNAVGYGVQAGLRVPYPLDFIIHGGAGVRTFSEKGSDSSSSYSSSSSSTTNEIDYWTGIAGFTLPIHITRGFGFYINTDYWFKTENGKGLLMFSGGLIF